MRGPRDLQPSLSGFPSHEWVGPEPNRRLTPFYRIDALPACILTRNRTIWSHDCIREPNFFVESKWDLDLCLLARTRASVTNAAYNGLGM